MSELLPSTQRLFAVLGYDMEAILSKSRSARDPYPVYYALTSWENDLFERIGPEKYEHGAWPATQEELDALRNALADQKGNSAGEELAYILVRCGCRQPETLAGLCAWARAIVSLERSRIYGGGFVGEISGCGSRWRHE